MIEFRSIIINNVIGNRYYPKLKMTYNKMRFFPIEKVSKQHECEKDHHAGGGVVERKNFRLTESSRGKVL